MANSDYKPDGRTAQFAPLSELAEPIDYLDRTIHLGRANFPRIDSLKVGMPALCDDEFMQITAIAPGQIAVKRGCADTVPAQHEQFSFIWFLDPIQGIGGDAKEHSAGETSGIKYAPFTIGGGKLAVEKSEVDAVTYNWRQFRPYPPGQMRVRGDRWWVEHTITADNPLLPLTWVHRDRVLQADQLLDHDDAGVGPEPGTTYTVRIYNQVGELVRTEVGIMADTHDMYGQMIPPSWTYTWGQAMSDLDVPVALELGTTVGGTMTVFSTRDGFDSWQGYTIPFKVNTLGVFIKIAQAAQVVGQVDDIEATGGPYPPASGVYAGQVAQTVAQPLDDALNAIPAADAMYVANLHESAGQQTNLPASLNRNLFEAPYALLKRRGESSSATKLVTMVARPTDRLTDTHAIWTRYDYPRGTGELLEYQHKIDPAFTPWITLGAALDYLSTTITIGTSSFFDGVALDNVQPGQVALVDAEIVRIESRTADTFTIARGVFDTVPTKHYAGARVWFFEAAAGNDPTDYPLTSSLNSVLGAAMQVKMVPGVYGPPVDLDLVPTDRLDTARRVERPYPPGEVLVNGQPWHMGAQMLAGVTAHITWNHRNRDTQGAQAVDHHAPNRVPEDGQKYRLSIKLRLFDSTSRQSYTVTIRNDIVDGNSYDYTAAMASADGYRAGSLLNVCGNVTVGMVLETIRGEFVSWQNYTIPLLLPSYSCPHGQTPGGGQLPPNTGGGNGDVPPDPNPPPPGGGGGDNTGGGDPLDPGGGGDDGSGPPPPPELPPDWPTPVDPQPEPDPEDPNPQLAGHWDTNWDRHWDAYNKDNQGT
jgi:hypothetical protein